MIKRFYSEEFHGERNLLWNLIILIFRSFNYLSENSRIQWKDLGEQIHMTGQAVGNRVKKLEENGVIKAYSLLVDEMKLGFTYTAFVIIYMKSANHDSFIRFINNQNG